MTTEDRAFLSKLYQAYANALEWRKMCAPPYRGWSPRTDAERIDFSVEQHVADKLVEKTKSAWEHGLERVAQRELVARFPVTQGLNAST